MKKNIIILILAVLAALVLIFWVLAPNLAYRFYPLFYREEILDNAQKYSLRSSQIAAIIYEESKFDPDVVSSQDAIGLMQILPDTANVLAKEMGINNLWRDDLFLPPTNIKFGCYYFRQLLDKYNQNEDLALAAYNAGFGAVDKAGGKIEALPRETQEFVKRVKNTEKIYITLYPEKLGADKKEGVGFWGLVEAVYKKISSKNR